MVTHNELLAILSQYEEPVSFGELKCKLGEKIPDRTLRFWLQKLAAEGSVVATGENKGRRYQLATAMQTMSPARQALFSLESLAILQKVQRPIFQRDPCCYNESWLKAYIPNKSFYLTPVQRKLLSENSILMLEEKSADTYTKKIFNQLLIDLSYNSSRLEGNTYSLLETQQLLIEGKTPPEKLDAEKLMILNHKEAIKFLVEGIHRIHLDVASIQSMHYLLADGLVLSESAGQVRDEAVRTSLTTYVPMEGRERLMGMLILIAEKANKIKDYFEQSFFLLVNLSYLQAFVDVNKRTARLCSNIPLVKNNLTPLSFNDIDKDDYISCLLAIYEYNETAPLADLYVWSYLRSCKQYQAISESIGIDLFHVRYRQLKRRLIAEIIQGKLSGDQMHEFIENSAKSDVPLEDQEAFILSMIKDLKDLEEFKILGMGISRKAFLEWKNLR